MATLPGLSLAASSEAAAVSQPATTAQTQTRQAAAAPTRTHELAAGTEFRFEVGFDQRLDVRLVSGTAELFGAELARSREPYTFRGGAKAAVFTWHGCTLELAGDIDSEYTAEETQMSAYANVHFALEDVRITAEAQHAGAPNGGGSGGSGGSEPCVLVVGPENAGKTSLVRILASYAVRSGRQPLVANLDPRQGMLSVPGSLTATAVRAVVDVEEGWGTSPVSGPSPVPVRMPLVYHYGLGSPDESKAYGTLVTRLAVAVTSRLGRDALTRAAGCILDTPGSIAHGKSGVYEHLEHIVSEFSVNVVLVVGSERLYSDLSRKYANRTGDEAISVIKLDKSGGCVDRDENYMKELRRLQIRSYFFGSGDNFLSPSTYWEDYGALHVFKVVPAESKTNPSFLPGDGRDDDDDVFGMASALYEKVTPSPMLQNVLLAVTTANASASQEAIRDASVLGYVYVADADDSKKKLRLLTPQSGRLPSKALVLGTFPEDVAGLVD